MRPKWRDEPFAAYVCVQIGRTGDVTHGRWWVEWVDYSDPSEPIDGICREVGPFDDPTEVLEQALSEATQALTAQGLQADRHPQMRLF